MIRKTPNIDSVLTPGDIAYAVKRSSSAVIFQKFDISLSRYTGGQYIYPVNSGIAALYLILKALSVGSNRTEVVLPAYTAGSLITAIRKAGLVPVLCDISLKDLNSDPDEMVKAVSERTLAVVCIHMFGTPMTAIDGLREKLPSGVTIIEDCAQAMGSAIGGKLVGSFGEVSFFSFNRGKNLPVCGGGCIATNDAAISEAIARTANFCAKRSENGIATLFKAVTFSIAANPYIYGAFYGIISRFKENAPALDFSAGKMGRTQAALALSILRRFDLMAVKRQENGMLLMNGLKGLPGIMIPEVSGRDRAAFNRFPVVFKDRGLREIVAKRLWRAGIESSRMYARPLHHMFDLGYNAGDFGNACYAAEGLLTLPVHPSVGRERLSKAVDIIRGVFI